LIHRLDQLRDRVEGRLAHDRRPTATRLMEVLGRVEQPVDPVGEPPQRRQLEQVLQHPHQVVALGLGELLPALDDQAAMLEHEVGLLLERRPATTGGGPGRLPLTAPLLLPPGPTPPGHRRLQPSHGVRVQAVDRLEGVEDAQLMVGVGPLLGQQLGVEVRAVGDHDVRHQPPGLEVLEEPPHVIGVVLVDQGEGHRQVGQRVGGR
jgi:hypothetical protein